MADVPAPVRVLIDAGQVETVNLMEWLAADMSALASVVSADCEPRLGRALKQAANEAAGLGITGRLAVIGRAIALVADGKAFDLLAAHRSDIVRQWACYAVNDRSLDIAFHDRLSRTMPFAADRNMTVRETAWMAFRPYVIERLPDALAAFEELARSSDENVRRFCVEVSRPRSVWGVHIKALKERPEMARRLLETVSRDPARYVRLAIANWLNDASKTRPDFVEKVCREWGRDADAKSAAMLRRAMRTINGRRTEVPLRSALSPA